ncbi:MAG TPA: hypothetical protein VF551_07630 [Chthoniobacterales bacterium]
MNGDTPRKIEIFAPFSAAMDLTKLILFQPFDFTKWLVIGFAAFLAHLTGGGRRGFNFNQPFGNGDWKWNFRSTTHDALESTGDGGLPFWVIPLILVIVVVVAAVVALLLWVSSRGRFIFADCVVRNRARIVELWSEFRKEGNSYFVFSVVVSLAMLVLVALAGMPLWIPVVLHGEFPRGAALVFGIGFAGLIALAAILAVNILMNFMIPIMYRRRCGAIEAAKAAVDAIASAPGPVILYVLFSLVLWVAFGLVSCLAMCVTCCITALPYVGTVIFLPVYVFFMSYLLLFVRQFGPDFDAWGNLGAVPSAAAVAETPAQPPPVLPPANPEPVPPPAPPASPDAPPPQT